MIRSALLACILVVAAGCAATGGPGSRAPTTMDPDGPAEPRLVETFALACATLEAEAIGAAARSQGFAVADATTRGFLGAFRATTVWVRGTPGSQDLVSWREADGVCEVFGLCTSQDAVFRAFLQFLAPQAVLRHTLDRPLANRFALVRVAGGGIHSLGFGAPRFRGADAVLLTRRRVPPDAQPG